ncbi:hypothetical protein GCM10010149_06440 [Nonomuraea roseoviolacea subsp. roseoviolacea]
MIGRPMEPLPLRGAGQLNFWNRLSPLEREALERLGSRRRVYAGDTLAVPEGCSMTVLMSGCWIRLQTGRSAAARGIIDIAGPGDLCSAIHATHPDAPHWLGELTGIERRVLSRGHILEVAGEIVPVVLGDLPNVTRLIGVLQSEHLHFVVQLRAAARLDVEVRLARLLLHLLYRFGERALKHRNALAPPLSQADLAAWVGASDSSVARVLGHWRRDGLVDTGYSSLSILNPRRMRDIANTPDMPFARFPATRERRRRGDSRVLEDAALPRTTAGLDLINDLPPGIS